MLKTKLSFPKILFIISILIAAFFALQVLGHKIILPFPFEIKYDNPTCACMTNNGEMLVADSANTRLIFSNTEGKVCHVENLNDASPINKVFQIICDGDYFYVRGIKYQRNSSVIASEKILRYDTFGKKATVLFEQENESEQRFSLLYDCRVSKDCLYYAAIDSEEESDDQQVWVFSVDTDPKTKDTPQLVFQSNVKYARFSRYLPETGKLYTSDIFGRLYSETEENCEQIDLEGHAAKIFLTEPNGSIIYCDPVEQTLNIDRQVIAKNVSITQLSANEKVVLYDNALNGSLTKHNRQSDKVETLQAARFSMAFAIIVFLKFISVIYLIVILLIVIIKFLRKQIKSKNKGLLRKIVVLTVGIIIVVAIAWFYSNRIYRMQVNEIEEDLSTMSSFFADTNKAANVAENVEIIDKIRTGTGDVSSFEKQALNTHQYCQAYIDASDKQGNFTYIMFYGRQGNRYRILYDSTYSQLYGESSDYDTANRNINEAFNTVTVSYLSGFETISSTEPICDSHGEILGIVQVGQDYSILTKKLGANILELSMELITIFVAAYIILTEGRSLFKGLKERKKRLSQNDSCAELAAMRPLNFLFCLVTSFDGVILVLITKEMLAACNYPSQTTTWLMALPSLAFGIGVPLGTMLYSFLGKRMTIKKLTVISTVILAAGYALTIPVIKLNLFVIFCALKFICGVANGISYNMISSMPYRTENESNRYTALQDKTTGRISSSILGAMIGGLIAQKFGNISLYVVNAVAFVPLIILMLTIIPKNCVYIRRQPQSAGHHPLRRFGKFITTLPMLSYLIFLTIPVLTVEGYKNFLFPLYSTAMDLPKLYVTSFYVFVRAIVLIINDPITKVTRKMDYWKLSVGGMLAMGVAFTGFALNDTIVWAVIMLLITAIFIKIVSVSKAMLWPRQAKMEGLTAMETTSYMSVFERIIFGLKETILSVFLLLGNKGACTAVGIFCIVLTLLFALTTRHSAMVKAGCDRGA